MKIISGAFTQFQFISPNDIHQAQAYQHGSEQDPDFPLQQSQPSIRQTQELRQLNTRLQVIDPGSLSPLCAVIICRFSLFYFCHFSKTANSLIWSYSEQLNKIANLNAGT
jgi:hypothetical protein